MEGIERHEAALTAYALDRLRSVPDICFYGETDPRRTDDRIGVVSFNLGGVHHALVAAILGYEGGIGVRNGCFCAQPYVMRLLGLGAADQTRWRRAQLAGDNTGRPGMVRVSFAAYNTSEDIEALVEMLQQDHAPRLQGRVRAGSGERRLQTGRLRRHDARRLFLMSAA